MITDSTHGKVTWIVQDRTGYACQMDGNYIFENMETYEIPHVYWKYPTEDNGQSDFNDYDQRRRSG